MRIFRKSDHPLSQEEITEWLRALRGSPYVAASGYDVTSVFRAKVGNDDQYYFAGVNVENPHHRLSTHGEEGCIAAMVTGLGKQAEIVEGWVMGAPGKLKQGDTDPAANQGGSCCGKCRQQIAGFAAPSVPIHSVALNGQVATTTVGEFLPDAFSYRSFMPELVSSRHADTPAPASPEVEAKLMRQGPLTNDQIRSWLKELESFDLSSRQSQAVIIRLANGMYVAGVKVEDAAFLSIDPMQSAIALATAEFGAQKVTEVHSFGKGRDGAELGADAYIPLTGSALQVLSQFAVHEQMPITLYNAQQQSHTIKLKDAARYLPTFEQPAMVAGPDRFVR